MYQINNPRTQLPDRALIRFDSPALGDTIAWMPYVNEWQKKYGKTTYVACTWSEIFDYPNLIYLPNHSKSSTRWEYVWPPNHSEGYYHQLILGALHNPHHEGNISMKITYEGKPLSIQACGARQLKLPELEQIEIKPKLKKITRSREIHKKYCCISVHASNSPQKYWNNPNGWQEVVDYLIDELGYTVICIDKKINYAYNGKTYDIPKRVLRKTGNIPLEDRMADLHYADFFIGNSSGLAWTSWAVGTHVFMINGFTYPENEMKDNCTHIYNPTVCTGCYVIGTDIEYEPNKMKPYGISYWNGEKFMYKPEFWGRCPTYEINNPKKMFECTNAVTSEMVVAAIKAYI